MPSETETRRFHLGDVLSVTTGVLVSPRYMDGIVDLLGYLTGEQLRLEELQGNMDACKRYLLGLHPLFADLDVTSVDFDNWRSWLSDQVAEFGEWVEVRRPGLNEVSVDS